jgi:hypothetical protein
MIAKRISTLAQLIVFNAKTITSFCRLLSLRLPLVQGPPSINLAQFSEKALHEGQLLT